MPARDPHVSSEQLADLVAGVLPDSDADAAAAHVAVCARCAAVQDRLVRLPSLLATGPAPTMPPDVADRLDAALAAESLRRSSDAPAESAAESAGAAEGGDVVVPISSRRRSRARQWFAGAATVAAALVAVSVAADVIDLGTGGSADSASSGAADSAPEAARESGGDAISGETEPDNGDRNGLDRGRVALPVIAVAAFGPEVERLYDEGDSRFQVLGDGRSPEGAGGDPPPGLGPSDVGDADLLRSDDRCGDRALRAAGVQGDLGPFVRLDESVVRLVASGPLSARTVQAYSCDRAAVVASAVLDLSR